MDTAFRNLVILPLPSSGSQGSQGYQGNQGDQGDDGAQGSQGNQGDQGETGTSPPVTVAYPARQFNAPFLPADPTKNTTVTYSILFTITNPQSSRQVQLLISPDPGMAGATSVSVTNLINTTTLQDVRILSGFVPAGNYIQITSSNTAGLQMFRAQEVSS